MATGEGSPESQDGWKFHEGDNSETLIFLGTGSGQPILQAILKSHIDIGMFDGLTILNEVTNVIFFSRQFPTAELTY